MPGVVKENDLQEIARRYPGKEIEWDMRRRCWDVGGEVFLAPTTLEVMTSADFPDQ